MAGVFDPAIFDSAIFDVRAASRLRLPLPARVTLAAAGMGPLALSSPRAVGLSAPGRVAPKLEGA